MIVVSLGSVLLGVGIVAVILLDVLVTALHPSAQSLVAPKFYRAVWTLVATLSHPLSSAARRRVLSWVLPSSIAGLLLLWLLALIAGYALIYLPAMANRAAFAANGARLGWGDAVYFSGACLTTMGFGDIVPRGGTMRALAISEGLCGLLVASVAITYVLSVFPLLPEARVVATTLNEETDGQVDALPMVRRYLAVGAAEVLAQRCRELATQMIIMTEAHATHPVLFYAHPKRPELSFLRTLLVVQRLIATLRYGLRRTDYPDLVRDPRVVGLEESFISALRTMGASLHLTVAASMEEPAPELDREYDALIAALRQVDLRDNTPPRRAERAAYARYRQVTDPYIHAYWANSGYRAEDLWADYPPYRGSTAPLPSEDDGEEE